MPVRVVFRCNGAGIEFISSGTVTGEDIIEANKKIYTSENLGRLKYKLIDRTGCTEYLVSPDQIREIAAQDRRAAAVNPRITIILISTTPLQYGMTRMWQTYTQETGFQTMIFRDRQSAEAWMREHIDECRQTAGRPAESGRGAGEDDGA